MKINVSQLLKESIGTEQDYKIKGNVNIMENGSNNAVLGKVSLIRTNRSILAKGEFNTGIDIDCSRCLNRFSFSVKLDFEEEYFPLIYTDADLPPDEADAFTIDENNTIDLAEVIRQYALIALPMKPLCSEDCIGLQDCLKPLNNSGTE
ncbi:DUF177 domain-containing protein [Chloroflexota bacterium]